jgi:hypothetical protein
MSRKRHGEKRTPLRGPSIAQGDAWAQRRVREVTKWQDEGASGPEAVALSYLSQGLPGFRRSTGRPVL